jgi:hypothetical protein
MPNIKFTTDPSIIGEEINNNEEQDFSRLFANELENQYLRIAPAFAGFAGKTHQMYSRMMIALTSLTTNGTISNAIQALGWSEEDHTKKYRTINNKKLKTRKMSAVQLKQAIRLLSPDSQIGMVLDDMHTPKSGRKIPYSGYVHDPLADKRLGPTVPKITWGHRYVHLALLIPGVGSEPPRTVTIALELVPKSESKKKQKKLKDMTPEELEERREWHRQDKINSNKLGRMTRKKLLATHNANCNLQKRALEIVKWAVKEIRNERPHAEIVIIGDTSYTCSTFLKNGALPDGCIYIGSVRKDAVFQYIKSDDNGDIEYGDEYKYTPESMYLDESAAFETCKNIVTGKDTIRKYKEFKDEVAWEGASVKYPVKVIAAKGLQYKNTKLSKARRREVIYLLSTSTSISAEEMCQFYHYRWGIETLHKALKSTYGLGDAQVFGINSVVNMVSAFALATTMKEIAFVKIGNLSLAKMEIRRPKWNRKRTNHITPEVVKNLLRIGLFRNGFFLRAWNSAKAPGINKGIVDMMMGLLQAG